MWKPQSIANYFCKINEALQINVKSNMVKKSFKLDIFQFY